MNTQIEKVVRLLCLEQSVSAASWKNILELLE